MAEALQESVALALNKLEKGKRSRLDVELPPGFPLGIDSPFGPLPPPGAEPSQADIDRGDRELASAFLLLFEGFKKTGALCVAFRTERLATEARRLWRDWGKTRIVSLQGFGGDDGLRKAMRRPFLVAVAPDAEQLERLSRLADEREDKLCLVLLNARIRGLSERDEVREVLAIESDAVFHVRYAGARSEAMLYRAASTAEDGKKARWVLVRRPAGDSPPEQIFCKDAEPSTETVEGALSGFWR